MKKVWEWVVGAALVFWEPFEGFFWAQQHLFEEESGYRPESLHRTGTTEGSLKTGAYKTQ